MFFHVRIFSEFVSIVHRVSMQFKSSLLNPL